MNKRGEECCYEGKSLNVILFCLNILWEELVDVNVQGSEQMGLNPHRRDGDVSA